MLTDCRIAMFTNTYLPHVGGVANSVDRLARALRAKGHRVLIVAPTFEGCDHSSGHVLRVPAIQHFNGSDFSMSLFLPHEYSKALERFGPDIIHAHHPYLLGGAAMRIARSLRRPLIFTHHTMYEKYTHYVPGNAEVFKTLVREADVAFCNICDHIIAPSESVMDIMRDRGVKTPISAVPTGIDILALDHGDGARCRSTYGIPPNEFVVGHVGRLAEEKNCNFLAAAVSRFIVRRGGIFLVVGDGPDKTVFQEAFARKGISKRLIMTGTLQGDALADAYTAMDVFAFASTSETQGMVIAEAMYCRTPVVALDAPGAREMVKDRWNGRLIRREDRADFRRGLEWVAGRPASVRNALAEAACRKAWTFSSSRCADLVLNRYESLIRDQVAACKDSPEYSTWESLGAQLAAEWSLWSERAIAAGIAIHEAFPHKSTET